ncbi:FAD-dependent oxidoreductase [Natronosporangium hydrolyticum]|uniref:FAD-dependent oxidoreductase n=1 Tax=Natronosporangium hydrolyticum TaxID=2811111 RepID=A0A895YHH2_9ACTN|nr:FAD-dependent oxidoreductase [Natronosporangium hydrolyticum]QSB13168.1 FAD-dependent oxidoreductase [Natronosporangium hydrolyticum]
MSADERTFVIVGASLAGGKAAETLRAEGFTGRVVLIGEETEPPYERPPLSKGYLLGNDPREQAFLHEPDWWQQQGIELLLGRRATMLDAASHTVTLDGVAELRYDKLLLATGSRVRGLRVPGHDLHHVRYLRTVDESDALLADLRGGGKRVVVIGAGWIGMEVAAAARHHGAEVTVVEREPLPLRSVLGDEVAALYRDLHEHHGVRFRFGSGVRELRGEGRELTTVVLDDGTELPADIAVVAIGVEPATELAVAADLTVANGVATDSTLRTSDPDIYACGDVAAVPSALAGGPLRVEHWARAHDSGPAAARSMLGQPVEFDAMPFFFTDQYDLGMEFSGWFPPGGYAQVVFRGDPALKDGKVPEYLVFWLDDQRRVRAGMNVNVWDVADQIQALIRAGVAVDPARLADPSVPLTDLLP